MDSNLIQQIKTFAPVLTNIPAAILEGDTVTMTKEMQQENENFLKEVEKLKPQARIPTLPASSNLVWKVPQFSSSSSSFKSSSQQMQLWNQLMNSTPQTSIPPKIEEEEKVSLSQVQILVSTYEKTISLLQSEISELKKIIHGERICWCSIEIAE